MSLVWPSSSPALAERSVEGPQSTVGMQSTLVGEVWVEYEKEPGPDVCVNRR